MSSEQQRLHRAAIAVLAIRALRDAAVPIVLVLAASIAGRGLDTGALERSGIYLVIGVAIASLTGYARWRSTSYAVDERGVHYKTGIVNTKATTVPLSRIQGLDTVSGPVQRLFGVVALHVQSAGGGKKGEIVLEAVSPAAVERIREAVRAGRPDVADAAEEHAVIERRLGRRELIVAALTAGQLGVVLPVLAASGQLLSNGFSNERDIEGAARLLPDTPGGWELALAALLVGAWALSAAGSIVSFAGFAVSRDGDRLRIRRGLLQRSDAVVPVRRIHAVRVVEGVLRRPFALASLRLEVAGYAEEAAAARTLFPLLPRAEVAAFLAELLPELADEPDGLAPPPDRAARRYFLPPAVLGAIGGALACLIFPGVAPWPLLAAPLLGLNGWWSFQAAGWRLRDGRLVLRTRRLARTTLLTPASRLQQHAIAQNPFQRRAGLADLAVAVGKGGHARVRHLEAPVAAELWERLRR
jgi:putative membrane protein